MEGFHFYASNALYDREICTSLDFQGNLGHIDLVDNLLCGDLPRSADVHQDDCRLLVQGSG